MSPEGASRTVFLMCLQWFQLLSHRDVTEHLQLLLRKAGHHLHTTAEQEVVRTIKEKNCYIALNPQKEEKETHGRAETFRLPDGNTISV